MPFITLGMERIHNVELGLAYLGDAELSADMSLRLRDAKRDLNISFLTPSKFRERKSHAMTMIIADKIQFYAPQFPVKLAGKIHTPTNKDNRLVISHGQLYKCDCTPDAVMVENETLNMLICPSCNKTMEVKMDSVIQKVRNVSSGANHGKILDVVHESLCMVQGLAPPGSSKTSGPNSNPLPGTDDYGEIMNQLTCKFPNNKRVTLDDVRTIILATRKRRHLKWAYYLYCAYTGSEPFLMTNEEVAYITHMYAHVLNLTACAKLMSSQHIPYRLMIIYRLVDICPLMDDTRKNKYLTICHRPNLQTIRHFESRFWRPICEASKNNAPLINFFYY